jgi:hypothetical protein
MYIWIILLVSAIWVLIDAKNIGVKKGLVTGMGNMGPWGWFFATLLLWIIGFPMYLYYRGKFKIAIAEATVDSSPIVSDSAKSNSQGSIAIDDLQKLVALKEKGLVTDDEFEAKKKQLLGL